MARLSIAAALCLCACGGGRDERPAPPPVHDAPPVAVVPAPLTEPAPPAPGPLHYDDDVPARPTRPGQARTGRPIEILLRSSPVRATVSVDGRPLGTTPQLWQGEADGRPHEFTFRADGYALARYRFLPVASGIVHATLEVVTDESNVEQAAPPEVQRAPDPAHPLPPPVDEVPAPFAVPVDAPAAPAPPPDAPVAPAAPDAAAPVTPPSPHGPTP